MKRLRSKFAVVVLAVGLAAWPLVAWAALSDAISPSGLPASLKNAGAVFTVPVSMTNSWQTLVTAIDTADNSGSIVLNPGGISRAAQRKMNMAAQSTTVQVRVRYATSSTITASTIQGFGFDDNSIPERLFDSAGNHALSFLSDATNDVQDGTYSYTTSQEVDANAATSVMFAIKVAATGTGAAAAVVQVRVK